MCREAMPSTSDENVCPLCAGTACKKYYQDKNRNYVQCSECGLVFVPQRFHLSKEEEKAIYDLHENDPQDGGYQKFLSRLTEPLVQRLPPNQHGLDFGCGPGPTLSIMLQRAGHRVDLYDPFYHNDLLVFSRTYDFICATEVVEHLREPSEAFAALFAMLKPGGWLGLMTKMVIDQKAFSRWHYIRDATHICFYSRHTFATIAQRFSAELQFVADDVILLHKKTDGG